MAIKLNTAFVQTNIPGAYFENNVRNTTLGFGASGVMAIIGEAEAGAHFSVGEITEKAYGPDEFDRVRKEFVAGPIVDAFKALSAASSDPAIIGAPNVVYVLKTNNGAKAQAIIDTDYAILKAKNWGKNGNKIKYRIVETQAENTPEAVSATIPAFGAALDNAEFSLRINGGAVVSVQLSNIPANHSNVATLVTELNGLLPSGISAAAGSAPNTIVLKLNTDPANHRKGWGKSLELIDSTPGDLAKLGLSAGLYVSSAESEVEWNIIRTDINATESLLAKGEVALKVGYAGTTATLSITPAGILTTTVSGGPGSNLNIDIKQFATLQDLAAFIDAQPGYTAEATTEGTNMKPMDLDKVSGIGIAVSGTALMAGRIKKSVKNTKDALALSQLCELEPTDVDGLASPQTTFVFLAGGAKGHTTNAHILDALLRLEGVAVNFIVPLFSRNASDDIADGLTESGSTYSIAAIHSAVKNHVLSMSIPKLKRHRLAIVGMDANFAAAKAQAVSLASPRVAMTFQKVDALDSKGEIKTFGAWMGAVVAAAMQCAGFNRGITNKLANVIALRDPAGFDSGSPAQLETALSSGLLTLQRAAAGVRWVSDQTTYGLDSNFVYNSIQAMYAADLISLDLAESFQRRFVGASLAEISANSALVFLGDKMAQYKGLRLIGESDDAPLGWKNAKIKINGPIMSVAVEIKLATSLYFILIGIDISEIQQTA